MRPVHRRARRHHALLVADRRSGRAGRPAPRRSRAATVPWRRRPPRRSKTMPSIPASMRQPGEPHDMIMRAALPPPVRQVAGVEAGQHRHRHHLGPVGAAALASSSIARPPLAWTSGSRDAADGAPYRLGDGVGDVVELEVEEDGSPAPPSRARCRTGHGAQKNSSPSLIPPT